MSSCDTVLYVFGFKFFFCRKMEREKRTSGQINWNAFGNDNTKWNLITQIRLFASDVVFRTNSR